MKYALPTSVQIVKNEDGPFLNASYVTFDGDITNEKQYESALGVALGQGYGKDELWIVFCDMDDVDIKLMRPAQFEEGYEFEDTDEGDWYYEGYQPILDVTGKMSCNIYFYNMKVYMPKPIQS